MNTAMNLTNIPYFNRGEPTSGFQEVWYLKMNQPGQVGHCGCGLRY
jgi:hypothetical protein